MKNEEKDKNRLIKDKILDRAEYPDKRMFDLGVSVFLIILLLPLMILTGVVILIFEGRPILFKQVRTGKFNEPFIIYKFRTMEVINEVSTHNYSWNGSVPEHFVFRTPENQKITKLGAFLRKYSLDELPQLINVIKGDMSLVGPRPEIPNITKFYDDIQQQRLLVKPGVTGYAQINGRSDINYGTKVSYDLYYIANCSLFFGLKIIWRTIYKVLTGKGAY